MILTYKNNQSSVETARAEKNKMRRGEDFDNKNKIIPPILGENLFYSRELDNG